MSGDQINRQSGKLLCYAVTVIAVPHGKGGGGFVAQPGPEGDWASRRFGPERVFAVAGFDIMNFEQGRLPLSKALADVMQCGGTNQGAAENALIPKPQSFCD